MRKMLYCLMTLATTTAGCVTLPSDMANVFRGATLEKSQGKTVNPMPSKTPRQRPAAPSPVQPEDINENNVHEKLRQLEQELSFAETEPQ